MGGNEKAREGGIVTHTHTSEKGNEKASERAKGTRKRASERASERGIVTRQWPEVSDFVARFCTLRESENTRTCENCTRNAWKHRHRGEEEKEEAPKKQQKAQHQGHDDAQMLLCLQ